MTDDDRGLVLSRRELLGGAIALLFWRTLSQEPAIPTHTFLSIRDARGVVVAAEDADLSRIDPAREWTNELCRSRVANRGTRPVAIKEVVLANLTLEFPASTPIYGEAFQMLSQNGGTLGAPKDLGSYTDAKHYKIPMPVGTHV